MSNDRRVKVDLHRGAAIALDADQANRQVYLWVNSRGTEVWATLSPENAREVASHLFDLASQAETR
jgi:hypothetical protein